MDFTKSTGENLAENSALRATVNHAKNDRVHHFTLMKEGRDGLYKGAIAALKQLGTVTQLPKQDKLWEMTDIDVDIQNEEIVEAMKQYEVMLGEIMTTSSCYVNKVHSSPIWCGNNRCKSAT
jgi:hypothetical protein